MKVVHINTKLSGGAAIASLRLHNALIQHSVKSKYLYAEGNPIYTDQIHKFSSHKYSFKKNILEKIGIFKSNRSIQNNFLKGKSRNFEMFSIPFSNNEIEKVQMIKDADIIHLHWVPRIINYKSFFKKIKKPIVWTLHDMNPFMGGFHYIGDFKRNESEYNEVEQKLLKIKKEIYSEIKNLSFISPSKWMYNLAIKSNLISKFDHYYIPNGIDNYQYKLLNRNLARQIFNLPYDKIIILFVSESLKNYRKGFDILLKSLSQIKNNNKIAISTVGKGIDEINDWEYFNLGTINDQRLMNIAFSAADLFVLPSREDNLPNVVLESNCSGTPVIAFNAGGIPEMITNYKNGIIVNDINEFSLADAINDFVNNKFEFNREEVRNVIIGKFSMDKQISSVLNLYESISS